MSDDKLEYRIGYLIGIVAGMSAIVVLIWLLTGCEHMRPCPPTPAPEVIRVTVPVPIPCPAPSEILEYKPILPKFDPKLASLDDMLKAMAIDYVRLVKSQHELAEQLRVYSVSPAPTPAPR